MPQCLLDILFLYFTLANYFSYSFSLSFTHFLLSLSSLFLLLIYISISINSVAIYPDESPSVFLSDSISLNLTAVNNSPVSFLSLYPRQSLFLSFSQHSISPISQFRPRLLLISLYYYQCISPQFHFSHYLSLTISLSLSFNECLLIPLMLFSNNIWSSYCCYIVMLRKETTTLLYKDITLTLYSRKGP